MLKWLDFIYEKLEKVLIFVKNSICSMTEFFDNTFEMYWSGLKMYCESCVCKVNFSGV